MSTSRIRCPVSILAGCIITAGTLSAGDFTWNASVTEGAFNNAGSWVEPGAPGVGDYAFFDAVSPLAFFTGDIVNSRLRVYGAGAGVVFNLAGQTYEFA